MPFTYVVTGASRGLGLEFTRQLLAAGENVIACARHPERSEELRANGASGARIERAGASGARAGATGGLPASAAGGARIERLDVTDTAGVEQFAKRLADTPVDVLINNAGIGEQPATLADLRCDDLARFFETNSVGPLRVAQALLPSLRAGRRKLIVSITSKMGSIAANDQGGWYAYRAGKAALNMITRCLAHELGPQGFVCVVMHPGWVRTDMGGPQAPLDAAESVHGMLTVMRRLSADDNGRFLDYQGTEIPW